MLVSSSSTYSTYLQCFWPRALTVGKCCLTIHINWTLKEKGLLNDCFFRSISLESGWRVWEGFLKEVTWDVILKKEKCVRVEMGRVTGRGNGMAETPEVREWRVLEEQKEVCYCQAERGVVGEMMSLSREEHGGTDDTGVWEANGPWEPCCEFQPWTASPLLPSSWILLYPLLHGEELSQALTQVASSLRSWRNEWPWNPPLASLGF